MKNDIKILVVDDEIKIVQIIKSYLEKEGYTVLVVYNGKDAIDVFEQSNPDLILLDLMLPDLSGEEICEYIRAKSKVPIIMLTAKSGEKNVINGLNIGADDYILKPFSPRELVARVVAILRRIKSKPEDSNTLYFNNKDLEIITQKNEIKKKGSVVSLTPKEYKILIALAKYPNKIFTRDELIQSAFGYDFSGFDRTIDAHIKNLRHKIETDTKNPVYILTVHSVGYRFGGELDEI